MINIKILLMIKMIKLKKIKILRKKENEQFNESWIASRNYWIKKGILNINEFMKKYN